MINLANGNLVVQSDDIGVKARGVDLAFRRTYNSQSQHDAINSDNTVQAIFGNGWTNTLDAHISYNAQANIISIYDQDGARYEYASNGQGGWTPPAGMQGSILAPNGNCYYDWVRKNGETYEFYGWNYSSSTCAGQSGQNGRLSKVYGRDSNNWLRLDYYYDGSGTTSAHISGINAVNADGQQLTLAFADWNGHRELSSIARPDTQSVSYQYDSNGNLTDVCDIGNNQTPENTNDTTCNWSTPHLHHQYSYQSGTHLLAWVNSPEWVMTGYLCGTYQAYTYDGSDKIASLADNGTSNPYIADGTMGTSLKAGCVGPGVGQPLQSAAVGTPNYQADYGSTQTQYYAESFTGWGTGTLSISDLDGHSYKVSTDGAGRMTQSERWTGSLWLVTNATWDSANNMQQIVDARGLATNFEYDTNRNLTVRALPAISAGQGAIFRPTTKYSYDSHNNLIAYCDPVFVHSQGGDWVNDPGYGEYCPSVSGAQRFTWDTSDASEPFGRLTDMYAASGYHRHLLYDSASQGGDYGLPTSVSGDQITQYDQTAVAPSITLLYDGFGNISKMTSGSGAWGTNSTTVAYDNLNRALETTDADGIASYACYYPNGQLFYHETAYQHTLDGGLGCSNLAPAYATSYSYDPDGNKLSITHHYGCIVSSRCNSGTTTYWYDGGDRLVESQASHDSHDLFPYPRSDRYMYDLSAGGSVSFQDASGVVTFPAHGGRYEDLCYCPGTSINAHDAKNTSPSWEVVNAYAFDPAQRQLTRFFFAPGHTTHTESRYTYDSVDASGVAQYGLLTSRADYQSGTELQSTALSYDSDENVLQLQFAVEAVGTSWDTPARSYTYDADGRIVSIATSAYGTETYSYDADGDLSSRSDPAGGSGISQISGSGSVSSPATIQYGYYPNGWPSAISVQSASINEANIEQIAYRSDGFPTSYTGSYAGSSYTFSTSYTASGRLASRSDPLLANSTRASYDNATGLLTQWTIPAGAYSQFKYDVEGDVVSYNVNASGTPITTTYDTNGEIVQWSDAWLGNKAFQGALGYLDPPDIQKCYDYGMKSQYTACGPMSTDFDPRTGAILGQSWYATSTTCTSSCPQIPSENSSVPWDMVGRYGSERFDQENHVLQATDYPGSLASTTFNYTYTPGGQLLDSIVTTSTAGSVSHTQHTAWGVPLFSTTSGGTVDDVKFSTFGDILPGDAKNATLQVWDRDFNGLLVSSHNSSGTASWASPGSPTGNGSSFIGPTMQAATSGFVASSMGDAGNMKQGAMFEQRLDGISNGGAVIQGTRDFSATLQSWSSPDAFSGDETPISQMPYAWNDNNWLSNEDPSGYFSGQGKSMMSCDPGTQDFGRHEDDSQELFPACESANDMRSALGPSADFKIRPIIIVGGMEGVLQHIFIQGTATVGSTEYQATVTGCGSLLAGANKSAAVRNAASVSLSIGFTVPTGNNTTDDVIAGGSVTGSFGPLSGSVNSSGAAFAWSVLSKSWMPSSPKKYNVGAGAALRVAGTPVNLCKVRFTM